MGENGDAGDLQDAVERSYRAQWGGRRFCLITAVVLFVLAVLSAVVFVVARDWFGLNKSSLKAVELCALTTSFVCLLVAVMSALEGLIRWQREKGQFPDRTIHAALCLSAVTLAGLAFLFFLFSVSWAGGGIGERDGTARVIRFVVLLFSGFVWLPPERPPRGEQHDGGHGVAFQEGPLGRDSQAVRRRAHPGHSFCDRAPDSRRVLRLMLLVSP